jgi:hypothetical protein
MFLTEKVRSLSLKKFGLGQSLGDFLTKASGHPARQPRRECWEGKQ